MPTSSTDNLDCTPIPPISHDSAYVMPCCSVTAVAMLVTSRKPFASVDAIPPLFHFLKGPINPRN